MKKTALCLWGWAAKWYTHIWVIKRLEELEYEITEISWTSMWALIWAFLAFWMTSSEMLKLAEDISLLKLFDTDFRTGLVKWAKIEKFLHDIFDWVKIENLAIPLKIIATDVESWEPKVFDNWPVVDAIRASISIPWVFSPAETGWRYYVDGYFSSNLPVEYISWSDVICSSCFSTSEFVINKPKKILWFNFREWVMSFNSRLINRSFELMVGAKEQNSMEKYKWNLTLIRPEIVYKTSDFKKAKEIAEIGYREAVKIFK